MVNIFNLGIPDVYIYTFSFCFFENLILHPLEERLKQHQRLDTSKIRLSPKENVWSKEP